MAGVAGASTPSSTARLGGFVLAGGALLPFPSGFFAAPDCPLLAPAFLVLGTGYCFLLFRLAFFLPFFGLGGGCPLGLAAACFGLA
jgi:hypothetical protein